MRCDARDTRLTKNTDAWARYGAVTDYAGALANDACTGARCRKRSGDDSNLFYLGRRVDLPRWLDRRRYLVEVHFHHLKRFGAIATRDEKTARNFLALVQGASARRWLDALDTSDTP